MYKLIEYTDNKSLDICKNIDVFKYDTYTLAKRKDGYYMGKILLSSDNIELLRSLQKSITFGLPLIAIKRIRDENNFNNQDLESFENIHGRHDNDIPTKQLRKKHSCFYCGQLIVQMPRHLVMKHSTEDMVKSVLHFKKGTKERLIALEKIRKLGDLKYSKNEGCDNITVGKIINAKSVCCPHCKGIYSNKNLRNHVRLYCKFKSGNKKEYNKLLSANVHQNSNKFLREVIFPRIKNERYFKIITTDESMVYFGNKYSQKYLSSHRHQDKMVTQNLRLIARIYINMFRRNPKLTEVKQIINAAEYENFVLAVKDIAGYNEQGYRNPSVVNAACGIIKHFSTFLKCKAISENNVEEINTIKRFQYLLEKQQNVDLTKVALEKRTANQRTKKINVPTTEQINKLLLTIDGEIDIHLQALENCGFNDQAWKALNDLILIYTMIFCRKRPGDIERIQLLEFERINIINTEHLDILNPKEQEFASRFGRCVTRGKLNQAASILFSKKHIRGLNLLIKYRQKAGVSPQNTFLFANPHGKNYAHLQAAQILTNFCRQNNFDATLLTATKCRYHLASSTARMEQIQQKIISKFMGHATQIHSNIYQKPLVQNDICTMGGILMACAGLSEEHRIEPVAEIIDDVNPGWLENEIQNSQPSSSKTHEPQPSTSQTDEPKPSTSKYNYLFENVEHETDNETEPSQPSTSKQNYLFENVEHETDDETEQSQPSTSKQNYLFENVDHETDDETEPSVSTENPTTPKKTIEERLQNRNSYKRTWSTPERHSIRNTFRANYKSRSVPTLKTCNLFLHNEGADINRSAIQVQSWIRADMERKTRSSTSQGWSTPQKKILRRVFEDYYHGKCTLKYPSNKEIHQTISNYPQLKKKTTPVIRSFLQHDIQYIKNRLLEKK